MDVLAAKLLALTHLKRLVGSFQMGKVQSRVAMRQMAANLIAAGS